jgi:hypothetical protein
MVPFLGSGREEKSFSTAGKRRNASMGIREKGNMGKKKGIREKERIPFGNTEKRKNTRIWSR